MATDRTEQQAYLEKILLNAEGGANLNFVTARMLSQELLDNGVEVTVPLPPEPPVFSLVKIDNGDIWIRTVSSNPEHWLLVDTGDVDYASWTDLLNVNAQPFYPLN
jgi:hypothetical protein